MLVHQRPRQSRDCCQRNDAIHMHRYLLAKLADMSTTIAGLLVSGRVRPASLSQISAHSSLAHTFFVCLLLVSVVSLKQAHTIRTDDMSACTRVLARQQDMSTAKMPAQSPGVSSWSTVVLQLLVNTAKGWVTTKAVVCLVYPPSLIFPPIHFTLQTRQTVHARNSPST